MLLIWPSYFSMTLFYEVTVYVKVGRVVSNTELNVLPTLGQNELWYIFYNEPLTAYVSHL